MRLTVLWLIPLVAFVAMACIAGTGKPSEAEYQAAQDLIQAHEQGMEVSLDDLATAREVIQAYDSPGTDWLGYGLAAMSALLGVPALGGRGRSLIGVAVRSLRTGDMRTAAEAALAYAGPVSSQKVIKKAGKKA